MKLNAKDILEIFVNTADGVFVVDGERKIIFWNKAAQNILGFKAKEVLGRYCYEVIAGRDKSDKPVCSRSCHVLNLIQRREMVENYDMLTHSKAGDPVWINVSIVAVPARQKELNAVVHIFRDITRKKGSEELIQELISTIKLTNRAENNTPFAKISPLKNQPKPSLNRRERQVLRLLAEGASTNAIAKELYISWATVRKHIQNILTKLGLHTKLQAVIYAIKNKLI
ncbi:MAG: PAS domain-containing protein [Deltaproteobacteria bacterium]|nr:PAS domain-containing protein [Deltaproteobacteria bacterium]